MTKELKIKKEPTEIKPNVDQVKKEFFTNISHELRTPITLTLSPLEGLLSGQYGEISDSIRKYLEIMARNQHRLLDLVNQILDLAKMEAGKMQLKVTLTTSINQFIEQRIEQFRPAIEDRNLELRLSLESKVDQVQLYLDLDKFDKVIFNLLSNAMKFTKNGSIEVITYIKNNCFFFAVKDTGIGIKQDQITKLFNRFQQADGSESTEFHGTGIGLSFIKEIAKLHQGDVLLESEYGKGSTFSVFFPLGKDHLNPQQILETSPNHPNQKIEPSANTKVTRLHVKKDSLHSINKSAEENFNKQKPTILYVDDNPDLRLYVRELLLNTNNVFLASSGEMGLENAKKYKPDLILSDLILPGIDGKEFCQKIREDVELKMIPFVLLTAKSTLDSRIEGLEEGADDYLNKPFSPVELLIRVKNLIALRHQQTRLKRELQAAKEIQQSLLPPLIQKFKGAEIEALYYPSEELSGDFYDTIEINGWVYFYLADITSHGTAAAQVTYLLKDIFRQCLSSKRPPSLPDLMKNVSQSYAKFKLEYNVGLHVARYNLSKRIFEYSRSNAPGALLSGPDSSQVLSVQPGPLISAQLNEKTLEDEPFSVFRAKLSPGDRVYFFTDGCYEFSTALKKPFGRKNLCELLASQKEKDWTKSVLQKLVHENGSISFKDDITILRLALI